MPATIYTLAATSGAFGLTGSAVSARRQLIAASGVFLLTGGAADLTVVPHAPVVAIALTSVIPLTGDFTPGQTVAYSVTFLNTATGAPIAPATVELRVLTPAMTEIDVTAGFTNLSTGAYSFDMLVYLSGTWLYRWVSTMPYAASEGSFEVRTTPFLVPP